MGTMEHVLAGITADHPWDTVWEVRECQTLLPGFLHSSNPPNHLLRQASPASLQVTWANRFREAKGLGQGHQAQTGPWADPPVPEPSSAGIRT